MQGIVLRDAQAAQVVVREGGLEARRAVEHFFGVVLQELER